MRNIYGLFVAFFLCGIAYAQPDTTEVEEDWDLYDQYESVDLMRSKSYANAKINGLSPQRFVSIGWDVQTPYDMNFSSLGSYTGDEGPQNEETGRANYTGGFRLTSNIPIISTNKGIWQMGLNYTNTNYRIDDVQEGPNSAGLANNLNEHGLRVISWVNTWYKPLNETDFLLFQSQADLAGDFGFDFHSLRYVRYSGAVLWGRRPNDNLQWAVGVSRTYRVGAMNYIPVVMYNWTSSNRKWGAEILAPARAHGRYNFSARSMLLFGYELEGASYRLNNLSGPDNSIELRRGEIKARVDYQFQLTGFFWVGIQAGYRINYTYNVDDLAEGREIFRGFGLFGNDPYAMRNVIGNPFYFNFSLSFVSP